MTTIGTIKTRNRSGIYWIRIFIQIEKSYEKKEKIIYFFEKTSNPSTSGNSLDENAIASHSPNDSLDGSAGRESGASTSTTTNDKQALCRGLAVGRVTPQNITVPQSNVNHMTVSHNKSNNNNINNVKKLAPKPPQKPVTAISAGIRQQTATAAAGAHNHNHNHRQHISAPKKLTTNRVNTNSINANQRSVSNVYIDSYSTSNHNNNNNMNSNKNFSINSQQINSNFNNNINTNNTLNQLSLMNLETTEL